MIFLTNINSGAVSDDRMPQCPALAMAYVPIQSLDTIYPAELALKRGTLYPELDKPFCGKMVMGGAQYA